jgi:hypothetical protein
VESFLGQNGAVTDKLFDVDSRRSGGDREGFYGVAGYPVLRCGHF